ncbi:methyltransferase domain-containing protein [Bipolaris maydis]|nr:methyltransferase domain-containing protein [Bipolaris maydis]KAJ6198018.1 methyltransferase domain-containing protein [Bipolaris maydis]
MGPDTPLPLPAEFTNTDEYVESLLEFATSSWLLQTLCGGVHILDFYTRSPDLYSHILPQSWRDWFKTRDIMDILDLLMREDLSQFDVKQPGVSEDWRDGPSPPQELLDYIKTVRKHLLARDFPPPSSNITAGKPAIPRHIAMGMKVKKVHEVDNFARYIDRLTAEIAASKKKPITHLVDFGSGQNYLGRALAAAPYSKHIVAVESKQHNIEGAKNMDMLAKLVPKPVVMRNKKEYRAKIGKVKKGRENVNGSTVSSGADALSQGTDAQADSQINEITSSSPTEHKPVSSALTNGPQCDDGCVLPQAIEISANNTPTEATKTSTLQIYNEGHGSVQYVEHIIKDGDLTPVIDQVLDTTRVPEEAVTQDSTVVAEATNLDVVPKPTDVNAMVISLHSCGNLVHYGLRSMMLNAHISAVAMVGCCYNLLTEPEQPKGVRLNITARMMAVQAPFNWGPVDSDLFFTRHFFRALLQRIFLDRGVVSAPLHDQGLTGSAVSANGHTSQVNWTPPNGRGPGLSSDGTTTPLTIGTLRKFAYSDFVSYVRAAIAKLTADNSFCEIDPNFIKEKMEGLTDDDIRDYEIRYAERKKELSVMWSLMAFSAGVVEAVVVTDRYLWLKEQEEVEHAWVEPVFEYKHSPRNLVVVGLKK